MGRATGDELALLRVRDTRFMLCAQQWHELAREAECQCQSLGLELWRGLMEASSWLRTCELRLVMAGFNWNCPYGGAPT